MCSMKEEHSASVLNDLQIKYITQYSTCILLACCYLVLLARLPRLGRPRAQHYLHKCSKRARCLRKPAHHVDNLTVAHHV